MLDSTRLGAAIKTKVEAVTGQALAPEALSLFVAVAEAIVEEMAYAEVSVFVNTADSLQQIPGPMPVPTIGPALRTELSEKGSLS